MGGLVRLKIVLRAYDSVGLSGNTTPHPEPNDSLHLNCGYLSWDWVLSHDRLQRVPPKRFSLGVQVSEACGV